jgi:hypothetical protein
MSSASSYEGSDKDSFFHKSFVEGSTLPPPPPSSSSRHSYLRKTDLLDTIGDSRSSLRDTDTWSVAATIDDQESVISAHGIGPASVISSSRMTMDRETDDDHSTLDGESSLRDHHLQHDNIIPLSHLSENNSTTSRLETLRDYDSHHHHNHHNHLHHHTAHLLRGVTGGGGSLNDDDDDKRSRSNAAEFGDDGARSATADFDHSSVASDDEMDSRGDVIHHNNVVDDQISAPPQPQPSFASVVTKSYAELLEENEILQSQLRNSQLTQKHQAEMISNLRSLTGCDDELYGKALNLATSEINKLDISGDVSDSKNKQVSNSKEEADNTTNNNNKNISNNNNSNNNNSRNSGGSNSSNNSGVGGNNEIYSSSPSIDHIQVPPIVNARTLTQKLARLAETLTRFVHLTAVEKEWRLELERALFLNITENYLNSLPFGTENQHLLNTAYSDQIRRFHSTLGTNFAKWYRRQTVQSLSLNPATKEYLEDMRNNLTNEMLQLLNTMSSEAATRKEEDMDYMIIWNDILELCAALSLEIHGGDADVTAQSIAVGSKFDEEIMALVGDDSKTNNDKLVKMVISPLFVDEEEVVLLPARVVVE